MRRPTVWRVRVLAGAVLLAAATPAVPQTRARPAPRPAPRLEPVAETRLLMEGLTSTNFHGLERLLKQRPADVEAWTFARGQALLIAESGNLLMLRPPRGSGEDAWMERAAELREAATGLARSAGARDYDRSRRGLVDVANACNRCHQTFRVPVRLSPFEERPPRRGE